MPVRTFTASVKNEDRHVHIQLPDGGTLLAVADGHGGADCAESVVATIEAMFQPAGSGIRLSQSHEQWRSGAEELLHNAIRRASEETITKLSGAVVTVVLTAPAADMLAWAQVGDTVAMWRNGNGDVERTPDHNCRTNVAERAAAEKRGGRYMGGYIMAPDGAGGLQPTRSLGDRYMGRVASKEPEVGSSTLGGPVLVSSDGIVTGVQGSPEAETATFRRLLEGAEANADLEEQVGTVISDAFIDDVTILVFVPQDAE